MNQWGLWSASLILSAVSVSGEIYPMRGVIYTANVYLKTAVWMHKGRSVLLQRAKG